MHRYIALSLASILMLAAVEPAAAGGSSQREVERMAQQFERLFQPLIGAIEARDLVLVDHGNGFQSLSYRLDRARRDNLNLRADDNLFRTLACGHMAAEPTNPATVVNAVIADLETEYNLWFAVMNATDVDELRKTTVKIAGPEEFEIEVIEEEAPYAAGSVQLIWFNPETPFGVSGVYTHKVTVKGGGKVSYRFLAEPASTTTLDR